MNSVRWYLASVVLAVATTRDDNGSMAGFYRVPPTA